MLIHKTSLFSLYFHKFHGSLIDLDFLNYIMMLRVPIYQTLDGDAWLESDRWLGLNSLGGIEELLIRKIWMISLSSLMISMEISLFRYRKLADLQENNLEYYLEIGIILLRYLIFCQWSIRLPCKISKSYRF